MIPLAPITLTAAAQSVNVPEVIQKAQPIRFANESPFALQVQLGGDTHWLNPWTADVYTPPQLVRQIRIVPSVLTPAATSPPTASLLITFAEAGESIDGAYPMNLDRQSTIYSTRPLLANITTTSGVTLDTHVTPPYATQAIRIFCLDTAKVSGIQVFGDQTGFRYVGYAPSVNPNPYLAPVEQQMDASYRISVSGAGGTSSNVWVLAVTDVELVTLWGNTFRLQTALVDQGSGGFLSAAVFNGITSLSVSLDGAPPAPWQAAMGGAVSTIRALAAAAAQDVTSSTPGIRIFVHGLSVDVDEAAGGAASEYFEVRSPSQKFLGGDAGNTARHWFHDCKGLPTAAGEKIQLVNTDSVPHNYNVSIHYGAGF